MRPTVLLRAPSPSRIRRFHWQWLRTGRLACFAEGHVLRASAADPFAEVRDGEIVPIPQSAPALRARAVLDEDCPGHHEISQGGRRAPERWMRAWASPSWAGPGSDVPRGMDLASAGCQT
jgi:hypothetical protein